MDSDISTQRYRYLVDTLTETSTLKGGHLALFNVFRDSII